MKEGWAARQAEKTERNIEQWPNWLRVSAGLEPDVRLRCVMPECWVRHNSGPNMLAHIREAHGMFKGAVAEGVVTLQQGRQVRLSGSLVAELARSGFYPENIVDIAEVSSRGIGVSTQDYEVRFTRHPEPGYPPMHYIYIAKVGEVWGTYLDSGAPLGFGYIDQGPMYIDIQSRAPILLADNIAKQFLRSGINPADVKDVYYDPPWHLRQSGADYSVTFVLKGGGTFVVMGKPGKPWGSQSFPPNFHTEYGGL